MADNLGKDKNQFITDRLDSFQNLISQSAIGLSNQVIATVLNQLDIVSGTISNSNDNLRRVSLVDKAFKLFNESTGIKILSTFANDIKDILQLGREYYVETIGNQAAENQIQEIIYRQLGLDTNGSARQGGYLDNLISDTASQSDLKQIIFQQVSTNAVGYNDLKATIKNFIEGTGQASGAFYDHYNQFAFDTYSEVDRLNSKLHADRLGLTHFIYNGGIVADSRLFCLKNHGKVFTVKQAQEWKTEVNTFTFVPGIKKALIKVPAGPIVEKGMEGAYDPVLMMGGIRCRHSPDFISDETATFLLGKQAQAKPVNFSSKKELSQIVTSLKENNTDTFTYYRDSEGKFIQVRRDLHEKIVSDVYKNQSSAESEKTIQMISGATANGKSTLLNSGKIKFADNAVKINPDDIKEKLPEYNLLVNQKEKLAASYTHEESSYISKEIRQRGIDGDYNLVIDAVGDGDYSKLSQSILAMKAQGHQIIADYVTLDTETSLKLAFDRYQSTGRYVPEEFIRYSNQQIAKIIPQAIKDNLFDKLTLWDINEQGNPRKILTLIDGRLTIFDQKLYQRFLDKANG